MLWKFTTRLNILKKQVVGKTRFNHVGDLNGLEWKQHVDVSAFSFTRRPQNEPQDPLEGRPRDL